jgi:fructosamine-3-kinase
MPLAGGLKLAVQKFTGSISNSTSLAGGDISSVYRLTAVQGQFALKTHAAPPAGFFASEASGLKALKEAGLDVPEVFAVAENFLLMEYLPAGKPNAAAAAEMLARMHSVLAANYGYEQNTYLATLLQNNKPATSAADFYFRQRLEPLLDGRETEPWQEFFSQIQTILNSCPAPALLHGDLWSGNLYHADRGPVFIDPAVYFGDPLTDIAMTKLFGGFGAAFYQAYQANSIRREYANELIAIFQVYPLLVHARLFGGGYYASAAAIRDRFIR